MKFLCKVFIIESFPELCFEGKWLQNRLRIDKIESRSLSVVDIQGHQQRGGFCIVPFLHGNVRLCDVEHPTLIFCTFLSVLLDISSHMHRQLDVAIVRVIDR